MDDERKPWDPQPRKIIQICTGYEHISGDSHLIALCDDGTVWMKDLRRSSGIWKEVLSDGINIMP